MIRPSKSLFIVLEILRHNYIETNTGTIEHSTEHPVSEKVCTGTTEHRTRKKNPFHQLNPELQT